jgi:hypothetical protein
MSRKSVSKLRANTPNVVERATWGDAVADLSVEDRERLRTLRGCVSGFGMRWYAYRLRAPLFLPHEDGSQVEVPQATEPFLWFAELLEQVAKGGNPNRLESMVKAFVALSSHSPENPLCPVQRWLAMAVEMNGGDTNLPWEAAKILEVIKSHHPNPALDLSALNHAMKDFGVTAKKRGKNDPKPRRPPPGLRGLALAQWAIDQAPKEKKRAKRSPRKTKRADG